MLAKEVGYKYVVRLLMVMDEKESAVGREWEKNSKESRCKGFSTI